jgi:hypothetical protein
MFCSTGTMTNYPTCTIYCNSKTLDTECQYNPQINPMTLHNSWSTSVKQHAMPFNIVKRDEDFSCYCAKCIKYIKQNLCLNTTSWKHTEEVKVNGTRWKWVACSYNLMTLLPGKLLLVPTGQKAAWAPMQYGRSSKAKSFLPHIKTKICLSHQKSVMTLTELSWLYKNIWILKLLKSTLFYFCKHLGKNDCSLHTLLNSILKTTTCTTLLISCNIGKCPQMCHTIICQRLLHEE